MKKQNFNILLEGLPGKWRDKIINTDFRQVLKYFKLVEGKKIEDLPQFEKKEIAVKIVNLFFPEGLPERQEEVFEFIETYIRRGEEVEASDGQKVFDFGVDSGRLYTAFRQSYNIDLTKASLHWWEFYQLFEDLPQNTKLKEVIQLRGEKPRKDDAQYNIHLKKMQKRYSIEQEEKEVNFDNFFDSWGR